MTRALENIQDFAIFIYDLLKSDRDVVIATAGMTGEGKTVFAIQLTKAYKKATGKSFDFDCLTWERKEMMRWIDGEGTAKEGQLPEYSAIIPDELIGMFYSRSWYEEPQKDSIKTFNACRDRHLLVSGNVPNFWELDGGFRSRVRYYVYIPERGKAWIFEQENNPFTADKWNATANAKLFRKRKNPFSSPNFICEIHYEDLTKEESEKYRGIRNTKRVHMNDESKEKAERYTVVRKQRDVAIKMLMAAKPELPQKDIAEILGVSEPLISMIKNGYV